MRMTLCLIMLLFLAGAAAASGFEVDAGDLSVFVDGVMGQQLAAYGIPGAVVSVVRDGEIIFSRGYGYADLDSLVPVSPDSTLFRIGSISKLFVWTSVMQLVESGDIDLHADVNSYLTEFQIPPTFAEPVTMADLLTHSAGFEEQELGVFVTDQSLIAPLGDYLADHMPERIRPPGELPSYSNYGTALAAYIVERVSGLPFDEYVRQNILVPLDMNMSTFLQPPPGMETLAATGYAPSQGALVPQPFEWIQAYPAGAMSSTANDMARFMIAHLQNGMYLDRRILEEETAEDMHGLHFTGDPRVNGWTWGFMQLNMGPDSIIWHGGDTYFFHSALYLFPLENTGIFVSYDCPAGAKARIDLLKAFLARYHPVPPPAAPVPVPGSGHGGDCSGYYLDVRSNRSTPERLMSLLSPHEVAFIDGHTVLFAGNRWVETEPLVFRNCQSPEVLVFGEGDTGEVDRMFRGNNPTTAYLKLSWLESPPVQRTFVLVSLALFTLVIVVWPVVFVSDLITKRRNGAGAVISGILLWLLSVLNAGFLAELYRMLSTSGFGFGIPDGMPLLLLVPWATVPLTAVLSFLLVLVWKEGLWRFSARMHFTLTVLASVLLVWWMHYWNVLFYGF